MEAKDTVIQVTETIVDEYSHTEKYEVGDMDNPITVKEREWDLDRLLQAQAEISFKAGYIEKTSQCPECTLENFSRGKRWGIKEVMETYKRENPSIYHNQKTWWQMKEEKWGFSFFDSAEIDSYQ